MALLHLVVAPDPRLETCSEEVEKVDDGIRKLMDDMVETMHHHEGIGLAAVQVGVLKRVLVMDLKESEERYALAASGANVTGASSSRTRPTNNGATCEIGSMRITNAGCDAGSSTTPTSHGCCRLPSIRSTPC